ILEKVKDIGYENICLTGGEPLIQEESIELIDALLEADRFEVLVETNGSIDIEPLVDRRVIVSMDYKTPSSNMCEEMMDDNLDKLRKQDQLKFVISDQEDYNFAKKICKKAQDHTEIIFQPAGGGQERLRWIAESVIQEKMKVRVLPQLHKIIWPGEKSR
ncbi:MAG: 7-carboxy-7-deazaguanine synthase QueE, partial [Thermoplasmatota archaeon]